MEINENNQNTVADILQTNPVSCNNTPPRQFAGELPVTHGDKPVENNHTDGRGHAAQVQEAQHEQTRQRMFIELADRRLAANERVIEKLTVELAKTRVSLKRNFFWQCFDLVAIIFTSIFFFALYHPGDKMVLLVFVVGFWAIRLFVRAVKYYKLNFKEGIIAYHRKRKEESLEREYMLLKRMNAEIQSET